MNLKHLTDKQLLSDTKSLAKEERKYTARLLHHIREIDDRKLYSDLGYQSLFKYVVQELGFSEGSAARRIKSARLLERMPDIEVKIESGDLNLTNISMAADKFKREKITDIEFQKDILSAIENTSFKTCEKTLSEIIGPNTTIKVEQFHPLNLMLSESTFQKYEKLRGLLAPKRLTREQMFDAIFQISIEHFEVKKFKTNSKSKVEPSDSRYISSGLKRAVYERDRACVKCKSTYNLQFDHIKPITLGGKTELKNLRLLCHNCNQRARISSNLHRP